MPLKRGLSRCPRLGEPSLSWPSCLLSLPSLYPSRCCPHALTSAHPSRHSPSLNPRAWKALPCCSPPSPAGSFAPPIWVSSSIVPLPTFSIFTGSGPLLALPRALVNTRLAAGQPVHPPACLSLTTLPSAYPFFGHPSLISSLPSLLSFPHPFIHSFPYPSTTHCPSFQPSFQPPSAVYSLPFQPAPFPYFTFILTPAHPATHPFLPPLCSHMFSRPRESIHLLCKPLAVQCSLPIPIISCLFEFTLVYIMPLAASSSALIAEIILTLQGLF